ncbi:MAG: DUF3618 domain-containing protein [Acetobacteraceae bacterium]|nr:DUF3618 domain-containing protein [Acetobacteraceae bacterium]
MSDRSPAQIEREVESTRANVEGTLDALRERLNPQQLLDQVTQQAMDYVRGSGGQEFMRNLGTGVRDNPLPVLLVGAGIAWMMLSPRAGEARSPAPTARRYQGPDNAREGLGETASRLAGTARVRVSGALHQAGELARDAAEAVGDAASRAADAASGVASRAAGTVSDAASGLAASAGDAAEGLRRGGTDLTHRVSDGVAGYGRGSIDGLREGWTGLDRLAQAQPLLYGALGLALGAALGAILPRTEAEDELMGEARDALVGQVRGVVGETYGQVRATAEQELERAGDAAMGAYQQVRERVERDGIGAAGEAVTEAARDVARTAGEAVRHVAAEVGKAADQPR